MRSFVLLATLVLAGSTALRADEAEVLFEEALHLEQVRGDLDGARTLYRRVAASGGPALGARARLRLATCLEKEGRVEEAVELLLRILREDADQLAVVRLALEKVRRHQELAEERLRVAAEVRAFQDERTQLVAQLRELQEKYRSTLDDLAASKESSDQLASELARKGEDLQKRISELEREITVREDLGAREEPDELEDRARRTLDSLAQIERVRLEQRERVVDDALSTAESLLEAGRPEDAMALLDEALRIDPRNPEVWRLMAEAQSRIERPAPGGSPGRRILRIHEVAKLRGAFERTLASIRLSEPPPGADPAALGFDQVGLWREDFEAWLSRSLRESMGPGGLPDPDEAIQVHMDGLLVRADPSVQEEVEARLEAAAGRLTRVLVVQVRAVFFGRGFLEEATRDWDMDFGAASGGFTPSGSVLRTILDPEREAALLERLRNSSKARLVAAPPLPLVDGQAGSVSLLAHTVAVVDHEKRRGSEHETFQPVIQRLAEGLTIRFEAASGEPGRLRGTVTATRLVKPLAGIASAAGTRQVASYLGEKASFDLPLVEERSHLLVGLANPLSEEEAEGTHRRYPHLALLVTTAYLEAAEGSGPAPEGPAGPTDTEGPRTYSIVDLIEAEGDAEEERGAGGALPLQGAVRDLVAALEGIAGPSASIHPAGETLAVEGPPEAHLEVARWLTSLRVHRADLVRVRVRIYALEAAAHDAVFGPLPEDEGGSAPRIREILVGSDEAGALFESWRADEVSRSLLPGLDLLAANGRLARLDRVTVERYLAGFDEPEPGRSGVPRPREETVAEGFALGVRAFHPFPRGAVHLTVSFWLARNLGYEPVALPNGLEARSPRLLVHRGLCRRAVPRGSWLLLGDLPAEAAGLSGDRRLVMALAPEPQLDRPR